MKKGCLKSLTHGERTIVNEFKIYIYIQYIGNYSSHISVKNESFIDYF